MMNFISQNIGSIVVGAVLFLIVFLVVKKLIRDAKNGKCSSCVGCAGCSAGKMEQNCESCNKRTENK